MKNKYKWLVLVVMAVTFLLCTQSNVLAEYKVLYVKSEVLNLRAGPSTNSEVLAKLTKGQAVIAEDLGTPWIIAACEIDGVLITGWVYASFVSATKPVEVEMYSYKDLLGDDLMQTAAILIIYNIILDAKFLAATEPESIKQFSKQLLIPKYKLDKGMSDDWKFPSRTLEEGGDCEDLTTFVIAKALTCFAEVGFIMMTPESVPKESNNTNSTHIAAVIRDADGALVVIDLACPLDRLKILPFDKYFKLLDQVNLTRYRVWWIMLPNSVQPEIKRIPK